jgi:hypothetical protein
VLTLACSEGKQLSCVDECVEGSEALIAAESGVWKEMRGVLVVRSCGGCDFSVVVLSERKK